MEVYGALDRGWQKAERQARRPDSRDASATERVVTTARRRRLELLLPQNLIRVCCYGSSLPARPVRFWAASSG